jgi:hypothetical protein
LCAFDQKVSLELGHRCNDGHPHRAGRTGQVDATKDKTVDPDASGRQSLDRGDHVDRVPAQTIQLGHHQHVVPFQSVEQFHEGRSSLDGGELYRLSRVGRMFGFVWPSYAYPAVASVGAR